MEWYNEPPKWEALESSMSMQTAPRTDFWRLTHSGYIGDNGHFYYQKVEGDFEVEVKVSGQYNSLYDQAGLMVRTDAKHWLKCGIEFIDGVQFVSAVVTREYSDWSIGIALPQNLVPLWLRLKRIKETIEIYYSLDPVDYHLLRQTYLPPVHEMNVGMMCASPEGSGFLATFENFTIKYL